MPWLFLLAAWVIAFVAVGAGYAAWNRAGLRLSLKVVGDVGNRSSIEELPELVWRSAPAPVPPFEGDPLEVEVGLVTTGRPRGPASVTGTLGAERIELATEIVPAIGWRARHTIAASRRGPVDATSWTVGSSDPLGFFRDGRECANSEVALVLPRFASLKRLRQVRELEASLAAPRSGSGTELLGVREYVPGDALRRIHWRSSARHARLVVREYEPPGAQSLGIFCDPSPPTRDIADQIARIAASEAWDCIDDGGRVVLWAPGLEPTSFAEARSLWSLLEWLARYPNVRQEAGSDPGPVGQAVLVMAAANEAVWEAAETVTRRGGDVRGWLVGDGPEADLGGPHRRVGLEWPL